MNVDFFDTNVILYLLDDGIKADTARELLRRKGLISVQVLNETLANCIRKKGMSWERAGEFIVGIRELCLVANLTTETHEIGRAMGKRYGFSIYDTMIVASALQCGCTILHTEDMRNGLMVEGKLPISNPFA